MNATSPTHAEITNSRTRFRSPRNRHPKSARTAKITPVINSAVRTSKFTSVTVGDTRGVGALRREVRQQRTDGDGQQNSQKTLHFSSPSSLTSVNVGVQHQYQNSGDQQQSDRG